MCMAHRKRVTTKMQKYLSEYSPKVTSHLLGFLHRSLGICQNVLDICQNVLVYALCKRLTLELGILIFIHKVYYQFIRNFC